MDNLYLMSIKAHSPHYYLTAKIFLGHSQNWPKIDTVPLMNNIKYEFTKRIKYFV
jgi:hypothetical protein